VHYTARGLYSRVSILFLIVLGQGLDQITGTFSNIVGPSGFGAMQVGLLASVATILIGKLSSIWHQSCNHAVSPRPILFILWLPVS
jgi:hypothetical protein